MGFLDSIIKKASDALDKAAESKAADAISGAVSGIVDGISGAVSSAASSQAAPATPNFTPAPAPAAVAPAMTPRYNKDVAEYVAQTLTLNFPGATVRREVGLNDLGIMPPSKSVPVTVLITYAGKSAAILIVPKNAYKNQCYVFTMDALERAGIHAMRLFQEFENKPEYVVGRVRSLLA